MSSSGTKIANVLVAAACALLVACGGGGTGDDGEDPPLVDAPATTSICGNPGDVGNDMGVGKYCNALTDCAAPASICAILGDPRAHFCTKPCSAGQANACGTDATCQCQGAQCGCMPNSCL